MKDAVAILRKDDDLVPALLQELTSPALPADWLSPGGLSRTWPPLGRGHGAPQPGAPDGHAHRPRRVLGRRLQTPRRLTLLDRALLAQTAVGIIVERLPGLVHRGMGAADGCAPRPIHVTVPRAAPPRR